MSEGMISREDYPDWVWKRIAELASQEPQPRWGVHDAPRTEYAFARYISQHEEPPVDPLEEEARQMALSVNFTRDGAGYQVILAALRRGMELAREQQP